MTNECALKKGSNQPVIDQAFCASNHLSPEALIDMASLTNNRTCLINRDLGIDSIIEVDPYELSFMDFTSCFYYQSGGSFNINLANKSFKPLLINSQTYTTTDCKRFHCNLYNLCLKAYSVKNQISENTISSTKRIQLANETFPCQSLATNAGTQTSLAWDNCLNILETTDQIIYTGDSDNEARVAFKLTYNYYSHVLDVGVSLIFTYKTRIPCYKNVYNSNDNFIPCPYSKYENNSIEEIKRGLQDSIHLDKKGGFNSNSSNFTKLSKNSNTKESMKHKNMEENDNNSISCESTIRTSNLLKNICKEFWKDDDEEEDIVNKDEYVIEEEEEEDAEW
jgi:hypothetical protein